MSHHKYLTKQKAESGCLFFVWVLSFFESSYGIVCFIVDCPDPDAYPFPVIDGPVKMAASAYKTEVNLFFTGARTVQPALIGDPE